MSLARLVVIEGPDVGREYELPMRGGQVGRGDGSLVQLTDPAVSRQHALIELRDGALCWVDDSGRARTLINGAPATLHRLAAGDEMLSGDPADGASSISSNTSSSTGRHMITLGPCRLNTVPIPS